MRHRFHRPPGERAVRLVLCFAIVAACLVMLYVTEITPLSVLVCIAATLFVVPLLSGALRPVVVVARRGLGVVGIVPGEMHWYSWPDILSLDVNGTVVSMRTSDNAIYQMRMRPRAAKFLKERTSLSPSNSARLEQITRP
jgi:hypothetical protein